MSLKAQQGLDFASVLPAIPRDVFVSGWHLCERPPPLATREAFIAEVKKIRQPHNLTPDTAIEATAWSLRRYTNRMDLERVLARLPDGAVELWHVDGADPREIEQRIF